MSDEPTTEVAVISEGPTNMLQGIMALARDPAVRVDVIHQLVAMQERMEDRQAKREFNTALHAAQAEVPRVKKGGTVSLGAGKGGYAFARREDIDDVLREVMVRHGFSITFSRVTRGEGGGLIVYGTLKHIGGHEETDEFPLPIDSGPGRNNLQALGSTDKYAQRYILEGFFNLVREGADNDGADHGKKFITEAQADELRSLCGQCGRQEGPFLDQLFAGKVRSFDELEAGSGFLAARSTMEAILRQRAKRGAKSGG